MIVCAKNYSYCAIFVQAILKCNRAPVFGRPLQVTVWLMLWDRYLVYLSVTLVYCGQTGGRIKMPLGTEVGLCPCDTVLDGDPAPLTEWGTAAMSVLAKRSPISSTAELLFETQRWIHTVNTSCDCLCHRRRNRFGGATRLTLTTTAHVNLVVVYLKPNSITLASSELAPNLFGASSELAPNMFGASSELFGAGSKLKFGLSSSLLAAN